MAANTCAKCGKSVYPLEAIAALDKHYHKQCFRCTHCDQVISLKGFSAIGGEPYCKPHYLSLFKTKGNYGAISGENEGASSSYNASQGFQGYGGGSSGSGIKKDDKKKNC